MTFNTQPKDDQIIQIGEKSWQIIAPAKINLNLLVGPLREDNFHPVDSVVSKITLYDEIFLELISETSNGQIEFSCEGFDAGDDADNLVVKAAKLGNELLKSRGIDQVDLRISLIKNIPTGAGLGGGSSDAAAILRWFDNHFSLNMPDQELYQQASKLGSDVPLFLASESSRMTGRGEIIQPIKLPNFYALLCMPGLHCPTGPVYNAYDQKPIEITPERAIVDWELPCEQWSNQLINDLRLPAFYVMTSLAEISEILEAELGRPVLLTGSGSSLFALFNNLEQAQKAHLKLSNKLRSCTLIVTKNEW